MIDSLDQLLAETQRDFAGLYARLPQLSDAAIADVLPQDRVLTRGTQAYARGRGGEAVG